MTPRVQGPQAARSLRTCLTWFITPGSYWLFLVLPVHRGSPRFRTFCTYWSLCQKDFSNFPVPSLLDLLSSLIINIMHCLCDTFLYSQCQLGWQTLLTILWVAAVCLAKYYICPLQMAVTNEMQVKLVEGVVTEMSLIRGFDSVKPLCPLSLSPSCVEHRHDRLELQQPSQATRWHWGEKTFTKDNGIAIVSGFVCLWHKWKKKCQPCLFKTTTVRSLLLSIKSTFHQFTRI